MAKREMDVMIKQITIMTIVGVRVGTEIGALVETVDMMEIGKRENLKERMRCMIVRFQNKMVTVLLAHHCQAKDARTAQTVVTPNILEALVQMNISWQQKGKRWKKNAKLDLMKLADVEDTMVVLVKTESVRWKRWNVMHRIVIIGIIEIISTMVHRRLLERMRTLLLPPCLHWRMV